MRSASRCTCPGTRTCDLRLGRARCGAAAARVRARRAERRHGRGARPPRPAGLPRRRRSTGRRAASPLTRKARACVSARRDVGSDGGPDARAVARGAPRRRRDLRPGARAPRRRRARGRLDDGSGTADSGGARQGGHRALRKRFRAGSRSRSYRGPRGRERREADLYEQTTPTLTSRCSRRSCNGDHRGERRGGASAPRHWRGTARRRRADVRRDADASAPWDTLILPRPRRRAAEARGPEAGRGSASSLRAPRRSRVDFLPPETADQLPRETRSPSAPCDASRDAERRPRRGG